MLIPYVYLQQQRKLKLEEKLVAVDGYEFPLPQFDGGYMRIEDCVDDENGTLDF